MCVRNKHRLEFGPTLFGLELLTSDLDSSSSVGMAVASVMFVAAVVWELSIISTFNAEGSIAFLIV